MKAMSLDSTHDNDGDCKLTNHTFYGVLSTILNLSAGIIKSYYKYVPSCDIYKIAF
jgi:hypothetical protein